VLPIRSALSDLGLIANLLGKKEEKNAPKLFLCLPEKSAFWPKKSKESYFYYFCLPHKAKLYLKISLNMEYYQIKFYWETTQEHFVPPPF
jgi:hypothetical protein